MFDDLGRRIVCASPDSKKTLRDPSSSRPNDSKETIHDHRSIFEIEELANVKERIGRSLLT